MVSAISAKELKRPESGMKGTDSGFACGKCVANYTSPLIEMCCKLHFTLIEMGGFALGHTASCRLRIRTIHMYTPFMRMKK